MCVCQNREVLIKIILQKLLVIRNKIANIFHCNFIEMFLGNKFIFYYNITLGLSSRYLTRRAIDLNLASIFLHNLDTIDR